MNKIKENKVSIEWESSGYSVLKNLNATVLGIFCEFIDNSIQSYKEKKDEILEHDSNYKLKLTLLSMEKKLLSKTTQGELIKKFLKSFKTSK